MLRGLRHHRFGFAQAFTAFALLAMAVRVLVPAGYMFAPSQDGRFITVALCSGHGTGEVVIDLTTGALADTNDSDAPSQKSPGADAPCVFAVAAALAAPEQPAPLPAVVQLASLRLGSASAAQSALGLAAPPPWSTGPPFSL